MKLFKTAIVLSILIIFIFFGAQFSWLNYTSSLSKDLYTTASKEEKFVDFKELQNLPVPVQKYFHLVLKDKSPIINKGYLSQEGEFKLDKDKKKYSKTQAQQFFSTAPRGFTWHAKIFIDAGVYVNVFDSYIKQMGHVKVKFLSLYTLAEINNNTQLTQGALHRYLAEAIWYPTALLPSQGVEWSAIDPNTAKATLKDGNTSVSLTFSFNEKGEISSIYSPDRFREKDGSFVATPWRCRVSNYVQKGEYLIPKNGDATWILEGNEFTYYKLNIKDVKYN